MKKSKMTLIDKISRILNNIDQPISRSGLYEILLHDKIVKPNTKNDFLKIINDALDKGLLDKNKFTKSTRKGRRLPNVMRLKELKKLANVIDNPKEMFIFLTAFFCGLRRSELANLRICDLSIDDENCMFLKIIQGKRRKDRFVTLPTPYVRILKLWLEYSNDNRTNDYLIPAKNGLKPINNSYLNTRFQLNCERANILKVEYQRTTRRTACTGTPIKKEKMYNFHFHSLRHSYATFRIEAGDSPQMVMEEMGHKDRETLDIYTHIALEARQRATNKVFGYGRELPHLVQVRREEERKALSYEEGQSELRKRQLELEEKLKNRQLDIEEKRLEIEKLKLMKEINPFKIEEKKN